MSLIRLLGFEIVSNDQTCYQFFETSTVFLISNFWNSWKSKALI